MLDNSKDFHQHASFSNETVGLYPNQNNLSVRQNIIRIWYFLWLILLFDTQLKHVWQIYTNKSFSPSSYSCLPMKVRESEVYKHIVQPLDRHCSCFFWRNLSLDTLAVTKIYTKFRKVKIRFSHILIICQKR